LQALSSEMQQFVTEYQWREKQQAKLQADYEKGLQALG
jgi:pantothenate kinase-related protein Tda10